MEKYFTEKKKKEWEMFKQKRVVWIIWKWRVGRDKNIIFSRFEYSKLFIYPRC